MIFAHYAAASRIFTAEPHCAGVGSHFVASICIAHSIALLNGNSRLLHHLNVHHVRLLLLVYIVLCHLDLPCSARLTHHYGLLLLLLLHHHHDRLASRCVRWHLTVHHHDWCARCHVWVRHIYWLLRAIIIH